jgi:hypothetical protein
LFFIRREVESEILGSLGRISEPNMTPIAHKQIELLIYTF